MGAAHGGVTLETRKRLTGRAMLSLKSEYEYYLFVPQMTYNNTDRGPVNIVDAARQNGTVIGRNDVFAIRFSARLTIGLGPTELFKTASK